MVTKYYGVFCVGKGCNHFILFGSYEVPDERSIGVDCTPGTHRCDVCGTVCTYQRADIAHSTSPRGLHLHYPHKD